MAAQDRGEEMGEQSSPMRAMGSGRGSSGEWGEERLPLPSRQPLGPEAQ